MPSTVLPPVPRLERLPVTTEKLDYADLAIIDLAKAGTIRGRAELARQVRDAMSTQGFFYVVNHGWTQSQNDRIFDIADVPFSHVSEDDKRNYMDDINGTGVYLGYKPRQRWHIKEGVRDEIEQYSVNLNIMKNRHPGALQPLLPEIDAFAQFCHFGILHPLLRLFALGLEIPEETFVNMHHFSADNESSVRFIKYYPRSEEDEAKVDKVWLKGHTDIGSVTILWSQPISALQILSSDGKWRWLRHIENALVINAGDVMEFLSGGFYKATIHRVIQPPEDQRVHARVGVFYFAKANDDVRLAPCVESPILQKLGINSQSNGADAPTMEQWRKHRTASYGVTTPKMKENGVEEELVDGVVVRHYN